MVTTTASIVGAAELPVLLPAPPKENGPVFMEVEREGPDLANEEPGTPGKWLFNVTRASKSAPDEPSPARRSTVAGRKIFSDEDET